MIQIDDRNILFLMKLLISGLVFYALSVFLPPLYDVQIGFAALIGELLQLSGLPAEYAGLYIYLGESTYLIVRDCLGWKSLALLTGLYYSSTSNYSRHARALVSGLLLIAVSNVLRVYSTILVAEVGLVSFEVVHSVLWRWSLSLVVLGVWIYWMRGFSPGLDPGVVERFRALQGE